MQISVRLSSIDGFTKSRTFKTLAGAQNFAHAAVGAAPTLGHGYAVSDDGVARITSSADLRDLFPACDDRAPAKGAFTVRRAYVNEDLGTTSWSDYCHVSTLDEAVQALQAAYNTDPDGANIFANTPDAEAELDAARHSDAAAQDARRDAEANPF